MSQANNLANDPAPILTAIIGGTGLNQLPGFVAGERRAVTTPWGDPSSALQFGRLEEQSAGQSTSQSVVFLARHGDGHTTPPHAINYRANIQALKDTGVSRIIAVNAVGGIRADYPPAAVGVPDQLIDYSYGRQHSFSADATLPLQHIDFTEPFDPTLRQQLLAAASRAGITIAADGTLAVTNGPRLETAAEINRYERDGNHLVGMTTMPEAALARELQLPYATLAVSVNWAAGKGSGDIHAEIEQSVADGMAKVLRILVTLLS